LGNYALTVSCTHDTIMTFGRIPTGNRRSSGGWRIVRAVLSLAPDLSLLIREAWTPFAQGHCDEQGGSRDSVHCDPGLQFDYPFMSRPGVTGRKSHLPECHSSRDGYVMRVMSCLLGSVREVCLLRTLRGGGRVTRSGSPQVPTSGRMLESSSHDTHRPCAVLRGKDVGCRLSSYSYWEKGAIWQSAQAPAAKASYGEEDTVCSAFRTSMPLGKDDWLLSLSIGGAILMTRGSKIFPTGRWAWQNLAPSGATSWEVGLGQPARLHRHC